MTNDDRAVNGGHCADVDRPRLLRANVISCATSGRRVGGVPVRGDRVRAAGEPAGAVRADAQPRGDYPAATTNPQARQGI